jgi:hypothetical protein
MTKTKTAAEITVRLSEIGAEESKLSAIDHDALMTQAVIDGEDLDAIEAQQADDERRVKRLRAERNALTQMLPEARKSEAKPQLDELAAKHAKVADQARERVEAILSILDGLSGEIDAFDDLISEAQSLTRQAAALAEQAGASCPPMGSPRSLAIRRTMVSPAMQNKLSRLGSISNIYDYMGHQGPVVDPAEEAA